MCIHMGIFVQKWCLISFFSFLSILKKKKKNLLVGPGKKHLNLTIYCFSSPLKQTHSKKFSFYFLSKLFYPSYFTSDDVVIVSRIGSSRQVSNLVFVLAIVVRRILFWVVTGVVLATESPMVKSVYRSSKKMWELKISELQRVYVSECVPYLVLRSVYI